jgi:hypothetical protein
MRSWNVIGDMADEFCVDAGGESISVAIAAASG